MRRGLLLGAALGVTNAGAVLLLAWALHRSGDFGWYSYSPMPRRYADYLTSSPSPVVSGWAAIGLIAAVLIALNMVLVATYMLVRKRRARID
jgi:heme/copper-type cytochrome/quinol oxidase subunit 1